MDVVYKEGMLYLQGAKFGKKTWRKVWVVLFKPGPAGVGRLELYPASDSAGEQLKTVKQKTQERKVVRLSDCLSVIQAPKESCPSGCAAFYLNTTITKYTLASTIRQEWLDALCLLAFQRSCGESAKGDFDGGNELTMEENDLYSPWTRALPPNHYRVKVQSAETSKRCKLAGDYLVFPDKDALVLSSMSGEKLYSWPYRLLRKFGPVEDGFRIEAGRRCDSGEGLFTFLTERGTEIIQVIQKQCSLEKERSAKSADRRSLCDREIPATRISPPGEDATDRSDSIYSDITNLSSRIPEDFSPTEASVAVDDDEEEICCSLEAVNFYHNLRKLTPPLARNTKAPDCIYSEVNIIRISSDLQPPPLPPSRTDHCNQLRCQSPHLSPVEDYAQLEYSAEETDGDEMEEAVGFAPRAASSDIPGSFKRRLAEIISKDPAKFQPSAGFPLPQ